MGIEVEVHPGAQYVAAQQAGRVGLLQRPLEACDRFVELAADIVVTHGGTHAVAGDGHALDQLVWVVSQDVPVLAGAWLTFIRIADEEFLARCRAGHEGPLESGRKTSTTTAAQVGELDLLDHDGRVRFFPQDALQLGIAADAAIGRQRMALARRQVQGAEADGVVLRIGGHGSVISRQWSVGSA